MTSERHEHGAPFTAGTHRDTGQGEPGPMLLWRFPQPVKVIASAILGGGIREAHWVINAHVRPDYGRMDPQRHLTEIAAQAGLNAGQGVGLLTAADLGRVATAFDGPEPDPRTGQGTKAVRCDATVGVSYPTWASAPEDEPIPDKPWRPGTINLVCQLPVPLTDAALVGAVITATEAKTQALLAGGVDGTGTASDAIVICCPLPEHDGDQGDTIPFAGPRSEWGSRLARAVYASVTDGLTKYPARARLPTSVDYPDS